MCIVFVLSGIACFGQNEDIDIKYLSSEEGKDWVIIHRPDGKFIKESLRDDIFTFYTNGTFKYDHAGTQTPENNGKTKTWSYDSLTNIVSWEIYLPSGNVKKYEGRIIYLDQGQVIMNFSEDGGKTYTLALRTK